MDTGGEGRGMTLAGRAIDRVRTLRSQLGRMTRERGHFDSIVTAVHKLAHLARGAVHRLQGFALDLRLGASTEGVVLNDVGLASRYSDHHYYEPVRGSHFREVLSHVDLDPGASTFVDLGSGRGRALLLAASSGFGRVIGVELDEDLIRQAQRNIDRWRSRDRSSAGGREFVLLHQDAATVTFPDDPMLVFLCNPFGETTLRHVLDRLVESHGSSPHPVWLCYVNPEYEHVVTERSEFEECARSDIWVVYSLLRGRPRGGPPPDEASGRRTP
jgi:16S rRNA G966 N2-methylase RsmD